MPNTWVTADPHFGHANILNFKREDGVTPLRPFASVEEMDRTLIDNWNAVVNPEDRVYLLGDVAFHSRILKEVIPQLKGRIVLVKGNHDQEKLAVYAELFDDVRAYVPKKGFILSHIPIHPGSLSRWQVNIHGHLHANVVKTHVKMFNGDSLGAVEIEDHRYVCVSVEHTNYTPKLLSKVLEEAGVVP